MSGFLKYAVHSLLHPVPHTRLCRSCDEAANGAFCYVAKAAPSLPHDSGVRIAGKFSSKSCNFGFCSQLLTEFKVQFVEVSGELRDRRVSMTLRHSGMEFSEFCCLSFGVC